MRHDWYRPGSICHYRAKLENGRIAALDGKMSSPSPAAPVIKLATGFDLAPEDPTITEGSHDQPYAIDHFRVRGYAPQLGIPVGFWRSVGGSQNGFFHESMIDELAYEAGADPLEFRLKHIRPEHEPAAKALETVAEMANWTSKTPRGVGRGIAHVWSYGSSVAEVINIRENDGMIEITDVWIAADLGVILDPAIVEAQLTGAAIYGLSAAIQGEITFANGQKIVIPAGEYGYSRGDLFISEKHMPQELAHAVMTPEQIDGYVFSKTATAEGLSPIATAAPDTYTVVRPNLPDAADSGRCYRACWGRGLVHSDKNR